MNRASIICMVFFGLIYAAQAQKIANNTVEQQLRVLEERSGGRLGLSAINMDNEQRIQYRGEERFPAGCTAKVIGVAALLKKSELNASLLNKKVQYTEKDLVNWTPITGKHVHEGMSVQDLCAAAISYSDNTAMNLLVNELGGLEQMNQFAKSLGDTAFRQDHGWPEEALSSPFDKTDSTTPQAMEQSFRKILFDNALTQANRELLKNWLIHNVTGNKRIRAGVPQGWTVGDKTGSGFHYGTTNDIAVIWPPQCKPIVITIYYSSNQKDAPLREDILASATKIVLNEFGRTNSCVAKALRSSTV
ncbi:class A beta-lactamase [uncultured Legionella sp.]|uniref:class A beta-lactamase n=1 Tax=uncultured Legionella sp. TaxID=210934 RepID=UPI0026122DA9|nr:class A beta-lactamase [uncultured Legionella sp.]